MSKKYDDLDLDFKSYKKKKKKNKKKAKKKLKRKKMIKSFNKALGKDIKINNDVSIELTDTFVFDAIDFVKAGWNKLSSFGKK